MSGPLSLMTPVRSLLLTVALSVAALMAAPSTVSAYCWFQYCHYPPPYACPYQCNQFDDDQYFCDFDCWETWGTEYCRHTVCYFLDDGNSGSCPQTAVCYSSDSWGCGIF